MIFINPQWQGSGLTDELKIGAYNIAEYFKNDLVTIPLSNKDLSMVGNIKCYLPILEQTESFRNIVSDKNPKKLSIIGGDCGIEIIPISYLNKIYDNDLCIIWIDAHPDLNTQDSSPSKTFHGMPLRTLLNEGDDKLKKLLFSFIHAEQICFVGLRDLDEAEREYIQLCNISALPTSNYIDIEKVINNKGYNKIYIHLDLDVLDQDEFRFTLFPSKNGLKPSEVANTIKKIKDNFEVVGICVTESTATTLEELNPIIKILEQVRL